MRKIITILLSMVLFVGPAFSATLYVTPSVGIVQVMNSAGHKRLITERSPVFPGEEILYNTEESVILRHGKRFMIRANGSGRIVLMEISRSSARLWLKEGSVDVIVEDPQFDLRFLANSMEVIVR